MVGSVYRTLALRLKTEHYLYYNSNINTITRISNVQQFRFPLVVRRQEGVFLIKKILVCAFQMKPFSGIEFSGP